MYEMSARIYCILERVNLKNQQLSSVKDDNCLGSTFITIGNKNQFIHLIQLKLCNN